MPPTTLTFKTATQFIKSPEDVDLSGFQSVDDKAAAVLAEYEEADLNLEGVLTLPQEWRLLGHQTGEQRHNCQVV